jgi:hypothetical protein
MRGSSIAALIVGALAASVAAPGLARISPNAKTFVYRGGQEVGYVQRSAENGPGIWNGLTFGQYISSTGTILTAYCTVGGLLYRWGVARPRSRRRWVISRIEPKPGLAGFVVRLHPRRWSLTSPSGKRVAVAKGLDGPAAGVAFLTLHGC